MRDVLVNVMWEHASRFRAELHEHLAPFFHLDPSELTKQRSEEEMLVLYRCRLERHCGVTYAADLRVPHPTKERTWFSRYIDQLAARPSFFAAIVGVGPDGVAVYADGDTERLAKR